VRNGGHARDGPSATAHSARPAVIAALERLLTTTEKQSD
jgi:hypothetical protein